MVSLFFYGCIKKIHAIMKSSNLRKLGDYYMAETKQININLPKVISGSIDDFIHYGDNWDIFPHKYNEEHDANNVVDINKTTLIKFLYSVYGDKETDIAEYIADSIDENNEPNMFISIRTDNPELIHNHKNVTYPLICAMVYMGIPIANYFDGRQLIDRYLY